MSPRFEIYRDAAGEWRFQLRAGNGEIVAVGEGYASRFNARRGARTVMRLCKGKPPIRYVKGVDE